jgi:hypothetical protein
MINLQDWLKTFNFKDDHDDQWATVGLLLCYLGDHWWRWIVARWLGYCLGNVNGWLFGHYHTKMTIKWWIIDCYPSNDNGKQRNDGPWTPTMMPTQNEMMSTIKKIMATYYCHAHNQTMNRKENIMCGRKYYVCLPPPHHGDDQFCLHKMKPWTKGKTIMGTYHNVIVTPWWWWILPTQNETMNKKGKNDGHLPLCDRCTTMMTDYAQCLQKMRTWGVKVK